MTTGLRAEALRHDHCACFDKLSMKQGSSLHLPAEGKLHPELVEG
jgi:hypothetical protein